MTGPNDEGFLVYHEVRREAAAEGARSAQGVEKVIVHLSVDPDTGTPRSNEGRSAPA